MALSFPSPLYFTALFEVADDLRDAFLASYDFEDTLGPVMDAYLATYPDKTPEAYVKESCFITCQLISDLLTLSSGRKPSPLDPSAPSVPSKGLEVWTVCLRPPYGQGGLNHEGVLVVSGSEAVIIDSYAGHRQLGVRSYPLQPLLDFIASPDREGWATYFDVPRSPPGGKLEFCDLEPRLTYVRSGLPSEAELRSLSYPCPLGGSL